MHSGSAAKSSMRGGLGPRGPFDAVGGQRPSIPRRSVERLGTPALAFAGGIGAAFAGSSPTGLVVWDAILAFAMAAVFVLAGSRAPRWAVIVVAALAAGAGGITLEAVPAWLALTIAVAAIQLERRNRLLGAIIAALAIQSLLRLPTLGWFGVPSVIAGLSFGLVGLTGYRHATKFTRRRVRFAATSIALIALVVAISGGVTMLNARTHVQVGVDAANRALDAARSGNADEASTELLRAESALDRASEKTSTAPARALRLLPIAAQHQRAISQATKTGASIARNATTMVDDLKGIDDSMQSGSVDLEALVSLAPRLDATSSSLIQARTELTQTSSGWLVPPLADRLHALGEDIDELLPEIELAAQAAAVVPAMLGIDGPQRYLVFFGTPAEAREFGGFVGSWGLLEFEDGSIELIDSGRKADLYPIARSSTIDPATTLPWFMEMARPIKFPENLTSSPDFEFIADMTQQVLGGVSEIPLAGLIYIDAVALIDMIQLTGPIDVPFQDEPLTPDNAHEFFFRDQYDFIDDRTDLFNSLAEVAATVLDQLSTTRLPGPDQLGKILGPAARGGHLQVVTFDESHNDFLESTALLRRFAQRNTEDFVGVVHSNGLSNKLDLYLDRSISYELEVDEDGGTRAIATVRLTSTVPLEVSDYVSGVGETARVNRVFLSLYTPHLIEEAFLNGIPVEVLTTDEFGLRRHLVQVDLSPHGHQVEVRFVLTGQLDPDHYSVTVWRQALVNPDHVDIAYRGSNDSLDWSGELSENLLLSTKDRVR